MDGFTNDIVIVNEGRVFRFAHGEVWMRESLARETRLLGFLSDWVDLPVPQYEVHAEDCVSYPFLKGQNLSRFDILRCTTRVQDGLAKQLAMFLRQIRSIPLNVLDENNIGITYATRDREDYLERYEEIKRVIFPQADKHAQRVIRDYFAPLIDGELDLGFEPCLIHGDLRQRNILYVNGEQCISGVLDFGDAGIGDPAHDIGSLLSCYGESFVRRMGKFTPEIKAYIDRARFLAQVIGPSWFIRGIEHNDPHWLVLDLCTARDILPVGTSWADVPIEDD